MSLILTLKGRSSTLSTTFVPPIPLHPHNTYGLALLNFHSYNSIPNIEKGSKVYLIDKKTKKKFTIQLPEGAFEISAIEELVRKQLQTSSEKIFYLKPNNNTLQCELYSEQYSIDFQPNDGIASLLGFSPRLLQAGTLYKSDLPVNIIKVRTIHIDSNITSGAFYNDTPSHTLYEFAIGVDPGFAIDETPTHLIYLPVVNRSEIHNLSLRVLDQDSQMVNFRGEEIIIRLELKTLS